MLAGQLTALVIVRGDEADVLVRLQTGIDHNHGNAGLRRAGHRPDQRLRIQRRQHDAADTLGGKTFDDLNLLVTIILLERTLPNHIDLDSLARQFVPRFEGTRVDGFPKLVSGAFGNDRNGVRLAGRRRVRGLCSLTAPARSNESQTKQKTERFHGRTLFKQLRLFNPFDVGTTGSGSVVIFVGQPGRDIVSWIMGGESRLKTCGREVWGFLFLIGFAAASDDLWADEPFLPPNSAVVLLAGLPGDMESEHQYLDQLQSWLKALVNVTPPPEKVFVFWESPIQDRESKLPIEVLKTGRSEFLALGKSLAGRTNPLVVIAWGHGGMQGKTPVFHVRGPRITPEDFKTVASQMPEATSRWVLMFRGSGRFASELAAAKRQIISSEKETMFASDPVGGPLLVKAFQNNAPISFPSLAEELGRMTAAW